MTARRPGPPAGAGRRPVARWVLLLALVVGLAASLAVHGLLTSTTPGRQVGPPVLAAGDVPGPLADIGAGTLRSAPGVPDTVGVALVDTGSASASAWRDAAEVLDRHGAAATWFVTGRTVLDRADAVAAVRVDGHEIGVTGFSGRDPAALAPWNLRVELASAQAALAARIGITTPLLLVPSSPTLDTIDRPAVDAARVAADQGYALVIGRRPEVARPGDVAVIPLDGRGAVRLEELLARLPEAGARAGRVSEAAGVDPASVNAPVGFGPWATARVVTGAIRAADGVTAGVSWLFLPLALLMTARALVAAAVALVHARRRPTPRRWTGGVTVIVPAYNEAAGIEAALRSLVASDWDHGLWVVVVDDGSTDGTAEIVARLGLPRVYIVRQANQGKPAALNAGLAAARTEVVVMVDGDTLFEPGTLAELVAPFYDPRVGAASGNAKVLDRASLLGRWQHIEYVMGFNLDRRLLATLGAITTVPGAVGAFRTAALRDAGGVSGDTLAEDTDVTIAVQRAGWRVVYQDRAVAWTEAPSSVGDLWRQRYRWCYGTLQAVWKHRRAAVQGRAIGIVGLPYALLFQVVVALLGPIVDVAALYGLVTGRAREVAAAWLGFTAAQLLLAVFAFRLDREPVRPLWAVPLQQVAYRQLMYLVVVQSVAAALAGTRLRWHKLRRRGLSAVPGGVSPGPAPVRRRTEEPGRAPARRSRAAPRPGTTAVPR